MGTKQVTIHDKCFEAIQFSDDTDILCEISELVEKEVIAVSYETDEVHLKIDCCGREVVAYTGDWILKESSTGECFILPDELFKEIFKE